MRRRRAAGCAGILALAVRPGEEHRAACPALTAAVLLAVSWSTRSRLWWLGASGGRLGAWRGRLGKRIKGGAQGGPRRVLRRRTAWDTGASGLKVIRSGKPVQRKRCARASALLPLGASEDGQLAGVADDLREASAAPGEPCCSAPLAGIESARRRLMGRCARTVDQAGFRSGWLLRHQREQQTDVRPTSRRDHADLNESWSTRC